MNLQERNATLLDQENLDKCLAYWQDCLRLNDWRITAKIVPAHEMGDNIGQCYPDSHMKVANISVMRLEDEPRARMLYPYDIEETLLHELVHLLLDPWKTEPGTMAYNAHEFACNAIAGALIKNRYEPQRNDNYQG